MTKTPIKNELSQFLPRGKVELIKPITKNHLHILKAYTQKMFLEMLSPNKDQPGISKTVFSHISNLHGLLLDWTRMRDKGVRLFKAVSALKLQECNDDYYPSQLKPLMNSVVEIVECMKNVLEGINVINNQLQSLAKLQPDSTPVILTWSVKQISENVQDIFSSLQKEYILKQVVTENVAHCRNEKLVEVYVSSWEFEPYFSYELHAYLFAEVGLQGIT